MAPARRSAIPSRRSALGERARGGRPPGARSASARSRRTSGTSRRGRHRRAYQDDARARTTACPAEPPLRAAHPATSTWRAAARVPDRAASPGPRASRPGPRRELVRPRRDERHVVVAGTAARDQAPKARQVDAQTARVWLRKPHCPFVLSAKLRRRLRARPLGSTPLLEDGRLRSRRCRLVAGARRAAPAPRPSPSAATAEALLGASHALARARRADNPAERLPRAAWKRRLPLHRPRRPVGGDGGRAARLAPSSPPMARLRGGPRPLRRLVAGGGAARREGAPGSIASTSSSPPSSR